MSHYHLNIAVEADEVKVIKEKLSEFMEQAGGFTLRIKADNDVAGTAELEEVIKKVFVRLLATMQYGNFIGLH